MAKFVLVTSGKGGVGKTLVCINIATVLSKLGNRVVLVDTNFSNPHVSLYLGNLKDKTLQDALLGRENILNVSYKHQSGLKVIPLDVFGSDYVDLEKLKEALALLSDFTDYVIIDGDTNDTRLIDIADEVYAVTQAEIASVTDTIKLLKKTDAQVIVNRITDMDMSVKNIEIMLGKRIFGCIPEDPNMKAAVRFRHPIVYSHPESSASEALRNIALRVTSLSCLS